MNQTQLDAAQATLTNDEPSEKVKEILLELYPQFTGRLAGVLEARLKERKAAIHRTLQARSEKEAKDITSILTELKKSIEAELNDPQYVQPMLFDDPERDQFERNKNAMRTRAQEIPGEIQRETEAIRSRFADPQARMFPVAVTFLVPEKLAGGA